MNNQWYAANETDVLTYFDVNPNSGLKETDILARLKKFGNNVDPIFAPEVQKVSKVTLLRNGKQQQVSNNHVVPGDIVLLSAGDRLPADVRLLHVDKLVVDQSSITGETSAYKNTFRTDKHELLQQKCMAFCGTFIVSGTGKGVVTARGKDTVIAKYTKVKRPKKHLATTLLARRLHRLGIIIQDQKVLNKYKDISLVFIEAACSDEEIINCIRKVQLTQRIPCKFIINRHQAARLAKELNATIWDIDAETNATTTHILTQLDNAQFIVGKNHTAFIKIASVVRKKKTTFLWITDGLQPYPAFNLADASLVVGAKSRGDVYARCSLIAPKATINIVTRILYNNK